MTDNEDNPDADSTGKVSGPSTGIRHRASTFQSKLSQDSLSSEVLPEKQDSDGSDKSDDEDVDEHPFSNTPGNLKMGETKGKVEVEQFQTVKEEMAAVQDKAVYKRWEDDWLLCHHRDLPEWMQDNDYLLTGHRPPLPSFSACFRSIFRLHSETVNIWTHLLGCLAFVILAAVFLSQPQSQASLQEKVVLAPFFAGAILCLGFSSTFHTVHCHSPSMVRLFSRLDYCGIALLIMGSFVPWLYYGFYCHFWLKVVYIFVVMSLGICAIVVSLSNKFGEPTYRPVRAAVFTVFGLSGVVPGVHCAIIQGWGRFLTHATPLLVTSCLYILGAALYAFRVPERIFLGKCDIWFQSHQIFHVLVVIATFINYRGIIAIALYEKSVNHCF